MNALSQLLLSLIFLSCSQEIDEVEKKPCDTTANCEVNTFCLEGFCEDAKTAGAAACDRVCRVKIVECDFPGEMESTCLSQCKAAMGVIAGHGIDPASVADCFEKADCSEISTEEGFTKEFSDCAVPG